VTTEYTQDSSIKYYTCTQRVQIYANEIYVEYTYKTRDQSLITDYYWSG